MTTTTRSGDTARLNGSHLDELGRIVFERSGVRLDDAQRCAMGNWVERRMMALDLENGDHYISLLSIGPLRDEEFQEVMGGLISSEPVFEGPQGQLGLFCASALPAMLEARKESRRLRIWSAACGTGVETWSLAMHVERALGARVTDWQVEILGTDLSERAISIAERGVYSTESVRGIPAEELRRHFRSACDAHTVGPDLRPMVSFAKHNLKDGLAAKQRGVWDVIVCRGVLGRFEKSLQSDVLELFEEQLAFDGRLLVGEDEGIDLSETSFEADGVSAGSHRLSM